MTLSKRARLAGLLYFLLLPTTGFWYATGQALMSGNAATTLANAVVGRARFEFAIAAGAIGAIDFLLLGVVFYWLFSPSGKVASGVLLAFVAASVPIFLVAVARQMDVLSLLDQAHIVGAAGREQFQVPVLMALRSYSNLFLVTNIFSGLWLIPLGWLVYRCGFMPRVLGVLLVFGSLFYVASFVGPVFDPRYESTMLGRTIGIVSGIPGFVGELGTILWLLIMGARERTADAPIRVVPTSLVG